MIKQLALTALGALALSSAAALAIANEQGRIVGGEIAATGRWPQQVSIQEKSTLGLWQHFCGGTIVNATTILTAAHCFDGGKMSEALSNLQVVVSSGRYDQGTAIAIARIERHAAYSPPTTEHDNDIALVTLAAPTTQPAAVLATPAVETARAAPGAPVTAIGWGNMSSSTFGAELYPFDLRQVDLQITNWAACAAAYAARPSPPKLVTANSICAGAPPDFTKDTCQADSGGPLYGNDGQGHPIQIGIVSFGAGCAQSPYPGAYTRVANYKAWIEARVPDALFATTRQSGWYAMPGDTGRGYALEIRGSKLFLAALMFGADGTPVWYAATGAMTDETSFSGKLKKATAVDGQIVTSDVAALRLDFSSDTTAMLQIDNMIYPIQRFAFVSNGVAQGTATHLPETGFYAFPNAPSGAMFVEIQGNGVYVAELNYAGADGTASWSAGFLASGIKAIPPASMFNTPTVSCRDGAVLGGPVKPATCETSSDLKKFLFEHSLTGTVMNPSLNRLSRIRF